LSAEKTKIDLYDKKNISLEDNTILYEMNTATTQMGKISFGSEFILLCAKTVAEYIKNNPDALNNISTD
jgi:hypothetical protein